MAILRSVQRLDEEANLSPPQESDNAESDAVQPERTVDQVRRIGFGSGDLHFAKEVARADSPAGKLHRERARLGRGHPPGRGLNDSHDVGAGGKVVEKPVAA